MKLRRILPMLLTLAVCLLPAPDILAGEPKVVVTLKPIHSLVAGVMKGIAAPVLLIDGAGSPHAYALRPSQARKLAEAALVVRVSADLESFLNRAFGNLAQEARILTLDETEGLIRYKARPGGLWKHDRDGEEHRTDSHGHDEAGKARHRTDEHAHGDWDPHIWLDPVNAQRMLGPIADTLSGLFPVHAAAFAANAEGMQRRLTALDAELGKLTRPLRGHPYIVFHDAYRYFEERYGLRPAGAISVSPDRPPGAKRLLAIRAKIKQEGAVCVFAEPQFEPRMITALVEGSPARTGTLDPLGAALDAGPELYFRLLRNFVSDLKACLAPD